MIFAAPCMAQTNFIMPMTIVNSDGSKTERAKFGIDSAATESLDKQFGEFEIPSLFPTILTAAFEFNDPVLKEEILSYVDIRPDFKSEKDSVVYHLTIAGIINTFTIKWSQFPAGIKKAVMKSTYLSDKYNWINMMTQDSLHVTNTAVTDFNITVYNYDDGVGVKESEQDNADNFYRIDNGILMLQPGIAKRAEIYSVSGCMLKSVENPTIIDCSNYPAGIYPIILTTLKGKTCCKLYNF